MADCRKCKSTNVIESENGNYCCNCGWDSTKKEYVKKQTNADKIRSMNDEELAEFLEQFEVCSHCEYIDKERCTFENPCVHEFATAMALKWLQSEAE